MANADRIVQDPAFITATTQIRDALVRRLEEISLDGSQKSHDEVIEITRQLQAMRRYQRTLWSTIDQGKFITAETERKARHKAAGM